MKDTLKQAVKSGDIPQIRAILVDVITHKAGNVAALNEITETIENVPGLFDKDDGKFYASSARDMTETLIDSLREDLKGNFSLPKFRLYTEAQALTVENPNYFSDRQEEIDELVTYPDGTLAITEEVTDGRITAASVSETPLSDAERHMSRRKPKASAIGRKIGYGVMAAGAATSIVGLCVPVAFMVGLGIGVIMLGSAIAYANIRR